MDIATQCGVADGEPGKTPRCWTWNVREAGEGRPARLAMLQAYWERYLAENRPDAVYYEAGMGLQAALSVGTNDDTFALLRGAIGVVEATAYRHRIKVIQAVTVQEARKHFTGRTSFPKGKGKDIVWQHCKMLRWPAKNLDESDAAAIWSLGCALSNPRTAHLTTELFGRC
jgi:hypothetical protein